MDTENAHQGSQKKKKKWKITSEVENNKSENNYSKTNDNKKSKDEKYNENNYSSERKNIKSCTK